MSLFCGASVVELFDSEKCGRGELYLRGYRVQARHSVLLSEARGGGWEHASPLILAQQRGTEGYFYVWHHRTSAPDVEYRLAQIWHDGTVLPIESTDPDRQAARAARRRLETVQSVPVSAGAAAGPSKAARPRQGVETVTGAVAERSHKIAWSWRLPILISILLLAGIILRRRSEASPRQRSPVRGETRR